METFNRLTDYTKRIGKWLQTRQSAISKRISKGFRPLNMQTVGSFCLKIVANVAFKHLLETLWNILF